MQQTRTQIATLSLVALLMLGVVALAANFIRPSEQNIKPEATRVPALAATITIPALSQASITPPSTIAPPAPTQSAQAVLTSQATSSVAAPATAISPATAIATSQVTAIAEASAVTGGPPTAVQQAATPTAVAADDGDPGESPIVPDTGSDGPDPVSGLTPPHLLPGVPTEAAASGAARGASSGAPNKPTAQPTPALSNSTPTLPPPTVVSVKATPKPKPGQIILPNGVVYGDRKPNLPNRIVRISSPNIRLDTPAYEVYAPKGSWEVADYAAGHHYNSKNPGEGGNIVVAGHNNWRGEVFRYLVDLKPGDLIKVWTLDGKEYRYTVESVSKLLEKGASKAQRIENGKVMDPTPSEQLTLITCWPYTTYTHRLIVVAKPAR